MIEFLPWSKKVLLHAFEDYKSNGTLNILDIELGGACNFHCQYCDTPKYDCRIKYKIEDLEEYLRCNHIQFVYVCGLGEPTVKSNISDLYKILNLCEKYNVKCSMFTNLSILEEGITAFIDKEVLYPIFKLDSFDVDTIKKVYNTSDKMAINQVQNIKSITKHVISEKGYTNIAASIVPSSINILEIEDLIKWCRDNDIFPLIGQLENAGKGINIFSSLDVSNELLQQLKEKVYECYSEPYSIPICPSVLFGLHINHEGSVIVDKASGLSCHWFWLEEPQTHCIGSFNGMSMDTLSEQIKEYRKSKIDEVRNIYQQQKPLVFGGCGGDIKYLLEFYLSNMA